MKTSPAKRFPRGFVSFLLVLTTGAILTMLMIYAYRSALHSQDVQSQVQMRVDYSEKEEAILRSIVAITPNRAILAMQGEDELKAAKISPDTLSWESIFTDSLEQANARTSIPEELKTSLGVADLKSGNSGDSKEPGSASAIFRPALLPAAAEEPVAAGNFVSAGINRAKVPGYPAALTASDTTTAAQDVLYPIISDHKMAGGLAAGTAPNFERLEYPKINFGYATPGDYFVAKRNWWAFSVDAGAQDGSLTHLARKKRNFVLSIYEIPSQLAISASSFMALGQFADGTEWKNVNIQGGLFVGKAQVDANNTPLAALSSRRSMTLAAGTTIGGRKDLGGGDPFAQGFREADQVASKGAVLPVSLASESGRAAFIPINRGALFFDRFAHPATEPKALSTTTWNNYSIGALQCAMQLDISEVENSADPTPVPTMLRFTCLLEDGITRSEPILFPQTTAVLAKLPLGFVKICGNGETHDFNAENYPGGVDVAFGAPGVGFTVREGLSGPILFDEETFSDLAPGSDAEQGYWRPAAPFDIKSGIQTSVVVYPERIKPFLAAIYGEVRAAPIGPVDPKDPTEMKLPGYNNSIVVNVDYATNLGTTYPRKPSLPCTSTDYAVVLEECANLTGFTSGFSLVSNLRLFMGDDFNTVATATPDEYPPCSLFTPERRIGFARNALAVELSGQIGSLAKGDVINEGEVPTKVRPLDSTNMSGVPFAADQITVNLSKIDSTTKLPPITMMNWLVLLEEVR